MHILITGGAGFIGSHTADALIAQGHRVRILDNLQKTVHPKGKPEYLPENVDFICGDVRNRADWLRALEGIDAVYHLAAYQDYLTDFSTFIHVNSVSTALLYEILVESPSRYPVRKVVVAASQAVMGEGRYQCPACDPDGKNDLFPEIRLEAQLSRGIWEHTCPACGKNLMWQPSAEEVITPCNPYAISKYAQEQIALQLGRRYGIPTTVMRYSIVQGPRQSFYNAYSGAMRIFALSLFLNRRPTIFEDGRQIRDFINIQDAVAANILVLTDPRADNRTFNVGGGKAFTVDEFYETMQKVTGKNLEPVKGNFYRFGDTRHIFSDTSRLRSLGWSPQHTVEESISDYWKYLQGQKDMDDILEYAETHMKKTAVIRKVAGKETQ